MIKRIVLTGAHGTGKTTVLNMFKEGGYPVITEVVRKLAREKGIKINEMGDDEAQKMIFNTYLKEFEADEFVSDRGLTDVMAYTLYLVNKGKCQTGLLESQLNELKNFKVRNSDIAYFYFPIEFELEDDGVRSIDPEFQRDIDKNLKTILKEAGINYFLVHGTPEERFQQIVDLVGVNL